MIALASGILTMLTSLSMINCHNITDAWVIALANGNLNTLTSLDIISNNIKISDAALVPLANGYCIMSLLTITQKN